MASTTYKSAAAKLADALILKHGLIAVITPATDDEFELRDGAVRSWHYVEGHLPFLPPMWWRSAYGPLSDSLFWLRDRRFIVSGEPTALRLKLYDRGGQQISRQNLPIDGTASSAASTLAAHLSAELRRRGRMLS